MGEVSVLSIGRAASVTCIMDLTSTFTEIRDKLDSHYDRRERLVKISRDITALSKKMIFSLHRVKDRTLPATIEKELEMRELDIQKLLDRAKGDVQGSNAYRYIAHGGTVDVDIIARFRRGHRNT
jgi:Translin family